MTNINNIYIFTNSLLAEQVNVGIPNLYVTFEIEKIREKIEYILKKCGIINIYFISNIYSSDINSLVPIYNQNNKCVGLIGLKRYLEGLFQGFDTENKTLNIFLFALKLNHKKYSSCLPTGIKSNDYNDMTEINIVEYYFDCKVDDNLCPLVTWWLCLTVLALNDDYNRLVEIINDEEKNPYYDFFNSNPSLITKKLTGF